MWVRGGGPPHTIQLLSHIAPPYRYYMAAFYLLVSIFLIGSQLLHRQETGKGILGILMKFPAISQSNVFYHYISRSSVWRMRTTLLFVLCVKKETNLADR